VEKQMTGMLQDQNVQIWNMTSSASIFFQALLYQTLPLKKNMKWTSCISKCCSETLARSHNFLTINMKYFPIAMLITCSLYNINLSCLNKPNWTKILVKTCFCTIGFILLFHYFLYIQTKQAIAELVEDHPSVDIWQQNILCLCTSQLCNFN